MSYNYNTTYAANLLHTTHDDVIPAVGLSLLLRRGRRHQEVAGHADGGLQIEALRHEGGGERDGIQAQEVGVAATISTTIVFHCTLLRSTTTVLIASLRLVY